MNRTWAALLFLLVLSLQLAGSNRLPYPTSAVRIQPVERINTALDEFAPCYYGEGLVYVARRQNGRVDPRTGQTFYELMYSEQGGDGSFRRPKPFSIELNSAYHEGPVSFSQDQREIFFTRSNTSRGLSRSNERGQVGLKIYRAFRGQYDWQGIEELSINDDEFSCMHPSLSADGNRLFFASDRPGGYGGLDLYVSDYINGEWTQAVNLGPKVNTSGDEGFPFIHSSGMLFFSSDGHPGQGGLDLFSINMSGPGWGQVHNLDSPFNSPEDDLSLVLNQDATQGYLSSNRGGGQGQDDIYQLTIPDGLSGLAGKATSRELITVYDAAQSLRLYQADIKIYEIEADDISESSLSSYQLDLLDSDTYLIRPRQRPPRELLEARQSTDREGIAELQLSQGKYYLLSVYRNGFEPAEIRFQQTAQGPSRPLEIRLYPSDCILLQGQVKYAQSSQGVSGALVRLQATDTELPSIEVHTDDQGYYQYCLPRNQSFALTAEAPGYRGQSSTLNTQSTRMGRLRADVIMMPGNSPSSMHSLGPDKLLIVDHIDWTSLQNGEVGRLELLRQYLLNQPDLRVRMAIHVDNRGHDAMNLDRSNELALLAKEYLIAGGIAEHRMEVVGLGERYPRKPCLEGQTCTEEDHALNNRVEVRILQ